MKSNLFINVMFAAMTLIAATACDEEEVSRMENSEVVTFAIALPGEPMTRYGEGEKATYLSYAVYEADSKKPIIQKENEVLTNKPTTLTLPLAVGKTYDIIFWADAYNETEAPYTIDFNTQQLTVSYDNAISNDEKRDAFFAGLTDLTVTRDMGTQTIEMKRPFAQFNVVADDLATSGINIDNLKTSVSVEGVPTELNLLDGTISTQTTNVSFSEASKAEGMITIGGKNYDYLSMNYLLVGTTSADATAQKSIHNCTFTYSDGTNTQTIKIPNVPMQRNYRTNVYGSLFNNNVNFSISILPGFESEHNHKIIKSASDLRTALAEGGNWVLQEDLTTDMALTVTPGKELNLDLGGNTLNATKLSMAYKNGTENVSGKNCTFANGVIDIEAKSGSSIQIVAKEMQVVFDNVTINSEDKQSAILLGTAGGDFSEAVHSTLVMRNCTINAQKTSGIVVGRQQNITLENTVINNANGSG
ncbi:FimB/Mfa2 family fimbrial subunit, partial [Parabacteroides timonensis]|uniref:FimB/Mfa2 family fimbrial subunit n=1 Tax=Parabacteroides timonensis TaxID=1871013 RepID=UPI000B202EE9